MSMTYASFIDAIEALSVTGITRTFQGPPSSLNTTDLPAMWVQQPDGEEEPLSFGAAGGWITLRADVLVAIEPVAQSIQEANFANQVTMLDNLASALRGADIGKAQHTWSIRGVTITVGGTTYWGAAARVTGRG